MREEGREGRSERGRSHDLPYKSHDPPTSHMTHHVLVVGTEEPGVMSLLHNNEGDARFIAVLQLHAGLTDRAELMMQHLRAGGWVGVW